MRTIALLFSLVTALPTLAQTVIFRDANVISMTSPKVAQRKTVVVKDDRIEAILDTAPAELPKDATIVEARGKFLMPGLADMHAHIPAPNGPPGLLDDVLFLYLANGVTTVRGMLGHDGQLNLREYQKKGEIVAPNLYVAGPAFTGQAVTSPEDAAAKVRKQKEEGWDLIKVHEGLTLEEYDALAKTAREVGTRFGGHVPDAVGVLHAIEMGQETFEHMDGFAEELDAAKGPVDQKKLAALVKKAKDAGIWVVPTSALWKVLYNATPLDTLRAYPELKYVPRSAVDSWSKMYENRAEKLPADAVKNIVENRKRILNALYKGGVKILMGTDAPQQFSIPGYSLHHELQVMHEAGMSNYDILRSGTVSVGEYFKNDDSFGTIEPGKRADLVLLNDSPLTDITNASHIDGVMVRGRWFSREKIDERLAKIEEKYAQD